MRYSLALAALLLPLGACVATPQPYGYGYGYGGYPQPAYADDYSYPGYAYNDGSPTYYVDGATVPLIFFGGSWGYYDGYRRFHRAPDGIERHLELRHPGGAGYRPFAGGGGFGRPEGFRQEGFRPGFRPEGARPEGFRLEGRPGGGFQGGGFQGGGFRPGGAPAGGPVTGFGPRPSAPPMAQPQRAAAPTGFGPRPAAAAPAQHRREDEHR
jgi:hypothetical protein